MEAIRIRPDLALAQDNLFSALDADGLLDEAIGVFREAIRIRPDYALAHYNLGIALKAKGLTDEAIRSFKDFIRYALAQYAEHVEKVQGVIRQLREQR